MQLAKHVKKRTVEAFFDRTEELADFALTKMLALSEVGC
jgi:hypothetical protein